MSDPVEYSNHIDRQNVTKWAIVSIVILLIGFTMFSIGGVGLGAVNLIFVCCISLMIFYIAAGHSEFVSRPYMIEIVDTGVILHRRSFRGSVSLRWEQIISANVFIGDGSAKANRAEYRDGNIWTNEGRRFTINGPIVLEIRERFREHMGQYPPRGVPGMLVP